MWSSVTLSPFTLLGSITSFLYSAVSSYQDYSPLLQHAVCLDLSKLLYLLSLLRRMDVILPFLFVLHPVDLNFCFSLSSPTSVALIYLYLSLGATVQVSSVAQSCPTPCDPMNRSTPGLPVHHQLPESTQTHVHGVGDAIQPPHPLSSPSPPAPNPSQHQSLFQ